MSISAISTTPTFQPNQQQNTVRQDFQTLTQALQSGNLQDAKTAYATLMQDMPSSNANGSNGSGNSFQQAIASIGSALQSGNLQDAQQALQTMQTQMKGAHHHHHHGASQQASDSSSDSTTSPPLPSTASVSLSA
jgi:soluble cytochrome b562